MNRTLRARPLTPEAFAAYGQVLRKDGAEQRVINAGRCIRFHDLATVECAGENARAILNIFSSEPCALPYAFRLVERHPLGSQAFMPLSQNPFLVIVAPDEGGKPGRPEAFITAPGEGINIGRNVWHGVLTPLRSHGDFLVVDRGGDGVNLEEFTYAEDWVVAE